MSKKKLVVISACAVLLLGAALAYQPLRLRHLFEQGRYEDYLAEAPRDGSYANERLEAAKQIRMRECNRIRPGLTQQLRALEAQGKFSEMLDKGGLCHGDKEIDALLAKPNELAAKRNAEIRAEKDAATRQAALQDSLRADAPWTCRSFVERTLKAPSTAKFQNSREFVVRGGAEGVFEVEGYVDAQNSFGAMLRTQFRCVMRNSGGTWHLVGLTTRP